MKLRFPDTAAAGAVVAVAAAAGAVVAVAAAAGAVVAVAAAAGALMVGFAVGAQALNKSVRATPMTKRLKPSFFIRTLLFLLS